MRLALRMIRRQPGFTLAVVLTLALGIGATSSIFSVLNAVVLRPLEYRDAERLAMVWETNPSLGMPVPGARIQASVQNFLEWRGLEWRVASIFSRAFAQLVAGAALGVAPWVLLPRSPGDEMMRGNAPVILPAVALFMMAVGIMAALGPARRCLRIEPTEALREQ